jgi:hypothetical protein
MSEKNLAKSVPVAVLFGSLLALCFEIAIVFFGAVWLSPKVNVWFNLGFDSINITVPISLLLSLFFMYKFFLTLIKSDRQKSGANDSIHSTKK